MSKNTQRIVEWQEEALRDYVNARMSPKEFADHIGVGVDAAYSILAGKGWLRARRPEDFCYPWTGNKRKVYRTFSQTEIQRALALREANKWSNRTLAKNIGVHYSTVSRWVKAIEHAV